LKDRSGANSFIPQIGKIEGNSVIPELKQIEAKRTRLILEVGKMEAKKTNWISSSSFFMLWSRGIDYKEPIPIANVA
jgi:hypothetical protein